MTETVLPHTQFVGVENRSAQKRIAENLAVLEKELRQVGSKADAQKLANTVALFHAQVLEEKTRPKPAPPKPFEPTNRWPDACFRTTYTEKERIKELAKKAGMEYGDYVLRRVLETPTPTPKS